MGTVNDATEESSGHSAPAAEDWPQGVSEASWWPIISAIGATGIYGGAALLILSQPLGTLVPVTAGAIVVIGSMGLFLAGLFGWLYHGFVVDFWDRGTAEHSRGKFRVGMLLFLGTEIATFGAGFIYYFFIRTGTWPPSALPKLLSSLVLVNTIVLVVSSVTLHFAHTALRNQQRRRFVGLLTLTLVLGLGFLAGQIYEYYEFVVTESFTFTSGIYASAFFGLTGLHGLHVTMGTILLAILLVRSQVGQYSAERHTSVSTVSMYWHFVDAVWILLVVALYVGATAGASI